MKEQEQLSRENKRLLIGVFVTVFIMVGATFAAVPLYSLFCSVTGYGGTIKRTEAYSDRVIDREVTVRFNADTAANLPWKFRPELRSVRVNVGQETLISYKAKNTSDEPVSGTATFNVTPLKAGKYFSKIQCFCFTEQTLQPGEEVMMPVLFYVDPSIEEDRNLDDIKTITLSYTFFKMKSGDGNEQTSAESIPQNSNFILHNATSERGAYKDVYYQDVKARDVKAPDGRIM